MIRLKKVNNHETKPILSGRPVDNRPVYGGELIAHCFATILCVARKKLGKTQLIGDITRHCVAPGAIVHAFVSTLYSDDTWLAIADWCAENGIGFDGYTSIYDDEGADQLARLITVLDKEAKANRDAIDSESDTGQAKVLLSCDDKTGPNKKKLPKYQSPQRVFIFDDLSDQLNGRSFKKFLKNMRHYKCKVLIGTQYLKDMEPQSLKQVDIWCVFKGQDEEKLKIIEECADLNIPFETFDKLYKVATAEPYSFLYIDAPNRILRKKFDQQFEISKK